MSKELRDELVEFLNLQLTLKAVSMGNSMYTAIKCADIIYPYTKNTAMMYSIENFCINKLSKSLGIHRNSDELKAFKDYLHLAVNSKSYLTHLQTDNKQQTAGVFSYDYNSGRAIKVG